MVEHFAELRFEQFQDRALDDERRARDLQPANIDWATCVYSLDTFRFRQNTKALFVS